MEFCTQRFLENNLEIENGNFVNGLINLENGSVQNAYNERGIQVLVFNNSTSTYKLYTSDFDGYVYLIKDDKECFRSVGDIFYIFSEQFMEDYSVEDAIFYKNVYFHACFYDVLYQANLIGNIDFIDKDTIDEYIYSTLNELYTDTDVEFFRGKDLSKEFTKRLYPAQTPRGSVVCLKTRITDEHIHVLPDFKLIYFGLTNSSNLVFNYSGFGKIGENDTMFFDSVILVHLYYSGPDRFLPVDDNPEYMDLRNNEEYFSFDSKNGKLKSVVF